MFKLGSLCSKLSVAFLLLGWLFGFAVNRTTDPLTFTILSGVCFVIGLILFVVGFNIQQKQMDAAYGAAETIINGLINKYGKEIIDEVFFKQMGIEIRANGKPSDGD